jgi:Flp pilus assembly protein CpaB
VVAAGSKVDVILTVRNGEKIESHVLLRDVMICHIGRGCDSFGDLPDDQAKTARYRNITFAATQEQCDRFRLGHAIGELHVVLRPPEEKAK